MQPANISTYQFQIAYHDRQGTLMRILGIVTRRGLGLPYLRAQPAGAAHRVTLRVAVNPKQLGQLRREWGVTPDVIEILEPVRLRESANAHARVESLVSAGMRRLANPESPCPAWRAALARLFAFVPSR
ncbi:MAG TPA: hypothetical protein VHM88_03175 [Candidatus Acidoferrales bacterium]|jgi:acetolactate synthase regulatory subunit|nr:hypothetical protein [Candidatus Acidoferrales bacterium]